MKGIGAWYILSIAGTLSRGLHATQEGFDTRTKANGDIVAWPVIISQARCREREELHGGN